MHVAYTAFAAAQNNLSAVGSAHIAYYSAGLKVFYYSTFRNFNYQIFGISSMRTGPVSAFYNFGAMSVAIPGWVLGTFLGAAAGTLLPDMLRDALGVAIYGMFIAIVIPPSKKQKSVRVCVVMAAALSCLLYYAPGLNRISSGFAIIICAVAVSAFCAKFFPIRDEEENA